MLRLEAMLKHEGDPSIELYVAQKLEQINLRFVEIEQCYDLKKYFKFTKGGMNLLVLAKVGSGRKSDIIFGFKSWFDKK